MTDNETIEKLKKDFPEIWQAARDRSGSDIEALAILIQVMKVKKLLSWP